MQYDVIGKKFENICSVHKELKTRVNIPTTKKEFEAETVKFYISEDNVSELINESKKEIFDINEATPYGSLLALAASCGAVECFKYLRDKLKIDVNVIDGAIEGGCVSILKMLIKEGCDFGKHVQTCIKYKRNRILDWIVKKYSSVNVSLTDCAFYGNLEAAIYCISNGADVNAKDEINGMAPLHWATMNFHRNIVELLLKNGADVNIKDKIGRTPIHYCTKHTSMHILDLLLEHGADINSRDNEYKTPLFLPAFYGDKETYDTLLSKGADATLKDRYGKTAEYYSTWIKVPEDPDERRRKALRFEINSFDLYQP